MREELKIQSHDEDTCYIVKAMKSEDEINEGCDQRLVFGILLYWRY